MLIFKFVKKVWDNDQLIIELVIDEFFDENSWANGEE